MKSDGIQQANSKKQKVPTVETLKVLCLCVRVNMCVVCSLSVVCVCVRACMHAHACVACACVRAFLNACECVCAHTCVCLCLFVCGFVLPIKCRRVPERRAFPHLGQLLQGFIVGADPLPGTTDQSQNTATVTNKIEAGAHPRIVGGFLENSISFWTTAFPTAPPWSLPDTRWVDQKQ